MLENNEHVVGFDIDVRHCRVGADVIDGGGQLRGDADPKGGRRACVRIQGKPAGMEMASA